LIVEVDNRRYGHGVVNVTLLYFDGCPNWLPARARVLEAMDATGQRDVAITCRKVETPDDARQLKFVGSATLLIDGRDPFGTHGAPTGVACRLYPTPDGPAGSPTVEQLKAVLM
jgi:hypothetical protein